MIEKVIKSQKRFNEYEMLTICFQITSGLKYLHSKNIIHRNIKPEYTSKISSFFTFINFKHILKEHSSNQKQRCQIIQSEHIKVNKSNK